MITISTNVIAAVAKWAGTDDARPHLHMVLFTKGEFVAVDGHRLVRVPLAYEGKPFGVDRRHLLAAVAAQRDIGGSGELTIEPDGKGRVALGVTKDVIVLAPFSDPATFPPYEQVMPTVKESPNPAGYGFDPRFLAAISEVTEATCAPDERGIKVTAWSADKLGAMAFENDAGVRFVVMPMRV